MTAAMLEYQRFDPSSCNFPRPLAPLLPALRWADLSFDDRDTLDPALLDGPGIRHFSRGRYALHAAYLAAGVGPSGALLAPAYHCRTMLDPALALGGAVRFYDTGPDLAPLIDSVRAQLATGAIPARALIVPHYFGFEQPAAVIDELASLCREHAVTLVEDCSHAWQVAARRAAGGVCPGRSIVASPYKFFGCEDGGVLWSADSAVPPQAARAALTDEAKGLLSAWTRGRRIPRPAPPMSDSQPGRGATLAEFGSGPSPMYQRGREGVGSLALSRWVMRRTRLAPLVARRRAHYQQWVDAVRGMSRARPLFTELPQDCAPYMFPLEICMPEQDFFTLKQAGLPIWRWDDMAVSPCPVANRYRMHLLHLPCHQDLTPAQMQWMTTLARKVLA